ncbi:hypothetical protein GCM10022234_00730 [Aeromicrobium panaciterrae]|uniref:hypothetical protein n=1 Tax=Aeromicrobium panaciterrae TaxID=363861 RepID=UPI0031DFE99B
MVIDLDKVIESIDWLDAERVLWVWSNETLGAHDPTIREGTEPGDFYKGLILAAFRADPNNRDRLRLGFASLIAAVEATQIIGPDPLRQIVRRHR